MKKKQAKKRKSVRNRVNSGHKRQPVAPPPAPPPDSAASADTGYEAHKERARERQAHQSRAGRDIAPLPAVKQPARRAACDRDLELFLLTFFPHLFYLPFSADQRKVIKAIQKTVLEGGLYAYAMPRGSGKTTIAECAAIWAIVYGHRGYVVILSATAGAAEESLDSIKTEFESNDLLAEDFPEVCVPIQALEGIVNRCKGQLYNGQRTHIRWKARQIVLPTIAGSKASGAVLQVAGLTGRVRGMKFKRPDGRTVRPDFVMPDDPQTRDSAESVKQCEKRERTLAGDVLHMAGPGKKIAGLMPCTVIRQGDLADRILDRKKHPEWNAQRLKGLYAFPTNQKLWDQYADLWADGLRRDEDIAQATKFYRDNRPAMDEGAIVAWPERYNPDELSGLQHLMNLKLQDDAAFWAEVQNEPKSTDAEEEETLTADQIAAKFNRLPRGIVPLASTHLVAFIDIQKTVLYYVVMAAADDFTGWVIDYGAFPDQQRNYFTHREARPTLRDVVKRAGLEGMIYGGLETLTGQLLNREWKREGGSVARIERLLIDANWPKSTQTVLTFCRQSAHAAIVLPSHGRFSGASGAPLNSYQDRPGERSGLNWRITAGRKQAGRHVLFDTNAWKSFVHARLTTAMGDKGSLSLFGGNSALHRMFADHVMSEKGYETESKSTGRKVVEWKQLPGRDNHWLDGLVGCHVAAAIQGASLFSEPRKQAIKLSEIKRQRRRRAG